MKRILFLTTLGVLPLIAGPGQAACVSVLPNITCTGISTGFTNAANGLSVTVEPGATVSRTTADAIRVRGDGVTVTNNGTIAGGDAANAVDGIDGGEGLTVSNSGTITGTSRGIDADDEDGLTVTNTGTITGVDRGIRNGSGSGASITNSGLIESQIDEGVETGNDAYVLNTATGIIRGSDDGLQVGENALIENYGLIESVLRGGDEGSPQDGIDIDSGTINNYATGIIRSDDDAAIDYDGSSTASTVNNFGTIEGTYGILVELGLVPDEDGNLPPPNTAKQIVHNHGALIGTAGIAALLGQGEDEVFLHAGSSIAGDIDTGADDDEATLFGDLLAQTVGDNTLIGGAGFDVVTLADLSLQDLLTAVFSGSSAAFVFASDPGYTLRLDGWETYGFGDERYTAAQVLAAVPVPATGFLLLPALGLLAGLRRRRA